MMAVRLVSAAELHFNAFVTSGKAMPRIMSIVWSIQLCTLTIIVPPSIRVCLSTVAIVHVIVSIRC